MQTVVSARVIIAFIWAQVYPFWKTLCLMGGLALMWAAGMVQPYLLKIVVDRVTSTENPLVWTDLMWPLGAYFLVQASFSLGSRLYGYFVDIRMIPVLRAKIGAQGFETAIQHSYSYYQNNFAGSLASKLNDLTGSIPELVVLTGDFFEKFLKLLFAIGILTYVNVSFGCLMLSWTVLFSTIAFLCATRFANLAATYAECSAVIVGKVVDTLSNMMSVRLFAHAGTEQAIIAQAVDAEVQAERRMEWNYSYLWLFYALSFVTLQGFSLYWLLQGFQQGSITIGDFVAVLGTNATVVSFLWQAARDMTNFAKYFGHIQQALTTILVEPDIKDVPHAKPLKILQGEICFEHVGFEYKNTEKLFKDKSIVIGAGQKVGLVGYSGSGKSTFVNLILRLYEVTSGRILIDGQDIRTVTQASLHSAIATIPQDPNLFHRTLRDNIRYGDITASEKTVIQAAQGARAHDFIMQLPQGYDALVGERGVKLSGGQRQRIAIARAILKNAPILILDEATSQLDSVTEQEIQAALWAVMEGKTTIVIAHRLSTLLHMDSILVFDQGVIVEQGTHTELLAQKGHYYQLWQAQVGGFLPQEAV